MAKRKTEPYIPIYQNLYEQMQNWSAEDLKTVILGACEYKFYGTMPDFDEHLTDKFSNLKAIIDSQNSKESLMELTGLLNNTKKNYGVDDPMRDILGSLVEDAKGYSGVSAYRRFVSDHEQELRLFGQYLSKPQIKLNLEEPEPKPEPKPIQAAMPEPEPDHSPMNDVDMFADRPELTDDQAPPENDDNLPFDDLSEINRMGRGYHGR